MDQIVSLFFVLVLILWKLDNSRSSSSRFKRCSTCHLVKRINQGGSECQQCMQWKSNNFSGLESGKKVCNYCKRNFVPVRGESLCDQCETQLANQQVGKKKNKNASGGLAGLIEGKPKTSSPLVGSYRCGGCATIRTKSTIGKRCPVCVSKGIPSTSDKSIKQDKSVEDDKYFKCDGCGFLRLASVRAEKCPTCVRGEMSPSKYQGVTPQNINAQKTKKYTDAEIKFIFSSISDDGNNYKLISKDEIDNSLSIINRPEWKKMLRPIIEKLPANMFYLQFEGKIYDDDRPVIEEFFRLWKQVSEGLLTVAELELMVNSFPEFKEISLDEIVAFIEDFRTTHTNVITPTLLNLEKFRNLFKGYCKSEGQSYGSKEDTESRCDVWWDKRVSGESEKNEKLNSFENTDKEQLSESETSININEVQPPPVQNAPLNLSEKDWDMLQFPIEELERQTPWDPMSYKELWRGSSEGIQLDYGVIALELAGTAGKAISSDSYYLETLNTAMGLNCKSVLFEISQSHRLDRMSADLGGKSFPAFGVSIKAATHLGILDLSPEKVNGSLAWALGAVTDSDGILVPVMIIASRISGVDEIAVVGLLNVVLFPEVKEIFAHLFNMRVSGDKKIPYFEEGLIATSRLGLIIRGLEGGLDIRMSEHFVPMRYWLNISQAVFLLRNPKTVTPKEKDFKLFCLGGLPEGESIFSSMSSGKFESWY